MLAELLIDKEKYLENHMQIYSTNCMDSETSSPIESQKIYCEGEAWCEWQNGHP